VINGTFTLTEATETNPSPPLALLLVDLGPSHAEDPTLLLSRVESLHLPLQDVLGASQCAAKCVSADQWTLPVHLALRVVPSTAPLVTPLVRLAAHLGLSVLLLLVHAVRGHGRGVLLLIQVLFHDLEESPKQGNVLTSANIHTSIMWTVVLMLIT